MLQNLQSTLTMSGAFPPTTEGAPDGVVISEVVPHGLSGPALGSDTLMVSLTISPEAPIEHQSGQLSGEEPHLAVTLQQQHAGLFAPNEITAPATAQQTGNQFIDLLSPIVDNLYATGAFMNPLVGSEEIAYIQNQHYKRAERLTPLMLGPHGYPVSYQSLRASDQYLIGRVARLGERHLEISHNLQIVQSTDDMIKNLVMEREAAMRRLREVDRDYALRVHELANFIQFEPTVDGSGWYRNVPQ